MLVSIDVQLYRFRIKSSIEDKCVTCVFSNSITISISNFLLLLSMWLLCLGFTVSVSPFIWRELQQEVNISRLLQCDSKDKNSGEKFYLKV